MTVGFRIVWQPCSRKVNVEANLAMPDGGRGGVDAAGGTADRPSADLGEGRCDRLDTANHQVDHLVRQLWDAVRFPIVVTTVRGAAVEHGLEGDVGNYSDELSDGIAESEQRRKLSLPQRRFSCPN